MSETFQRIIRTLNQALFAQGSVIFRGDRLFAFTADRLLYLWLHRLGFMGRDGLKDISARICPGMVVVDLGANVGVFTAAFSRLTGPLGKVIALEPAPANLRSLACARQANKWMNLEIHALAAADNEVGLALDCSPFNSGNNSLSRNRTGDGIVSVSTIRLDTLLAGQRVDFVKIDVQGWEASVLRGALETLRHNRPLTVRLEIWPKGLQKAGSNVGEVLELLDDCGLVVEEPLSSNFDAIMRKKSYFDLTATAL